MSTAPLIDLLARVGGCARGLVFKISKFEVAAYLLLGLAGTLLTLSYLTDHRKAQEAALANFRLRQQVEVRRVATHVESSLRHVYQGLRTIARLPAIRQLDAGNRTLSPDALTSVQEIYNNLAQNVSVSELYVVPAGFDPDKIDPITGRPEKPLMTFDALIVGRTADETQSHTAAAHVEEVEIHEYRMMRRQLAWLHQRHATEASFGPLDYPGIASEEVVTCDNTRYSPSGPNDDRRKGIVYSVPFYSADGKLGGIVSAIVLSDVLAELLPNDRFGLHHADHRLLVARNRSATWGNRLSASGHGVDFAGVSYASVEKLNFPSGEAGWTLISIDAEFSNSTLSGALTDRLRYEVAALAAMLLLGAAMVRWQASRHHSMVTRNHELEAGISARTTALDAATREAERANAAKSQFLANVSHEIRTPIQAIISAADLAEAAGVPEPLAQKVAIIRQAGNGLIDLVNQVLDLSAIEQGRLGLRHEPFSPNQLASESSAIVRLAAERKGLTFSLRVDDDVPATAYGDRGRLQQVLLNLLGNAIRYTSEGEVSLRIGLDSCSGPEAPRKLLIQVRDTGPGIEPALRSEIFEPFRRGSASSAQSSDGAGLGLAISKQLVELMGGTITFACPLEGGTRFVVSVPCLDDGRSDVPHAAIAAAVHSVGDGHAALDLHILLAEDNLQMQMLTRELLELMGCRVTTAANGAEAVDWIAKDGFDLVLMDCRMPVVDGLEAARRIRAHEVATNAAQVPIVALTANAFGEDQHQCLTVGMTDFLSKPFTRDELAACVARYSRRSSSNSEF